MADYPPIERDLIVTALVGLALLALVVWVLS